MKTAWLFPGQASQKVGMGRDLFEESDLGKAYFETANDILGTDIQSIIFDGPEESLRQTQFTQPAIFIVSTLLGGLLRQRGHEPAAAAGHRGAYVVGGGGARSLGEGGGSVVYTPEHIIITSPGDCCAQCSSGKYSKDRYSDSTLGRRISYDI